MYSTPGEAVLSAKVVPVVEPIWVATPEPMARKIFTPVPPSAGVQLMATLVRDTPFCAVTLVGGPTYRQPVSELLNALVPVPSPPTAFTA